MTSADSPLADSDENLSDVDDNSIDLFWKGVVKPEVPLVVSRMEGYFLRVTNASLGPDVQTNTRSCLTVVQASDEESEKPGIICTLKNDYENHPLNLLLTEQGRRNSRIIYFCTHSHNRTFDFFFLFSE